MKPYFYIFAVHFLYINLCNYKSSVHPQKDSEHQRVSREINANTNNSMLIPYLEANSGASAVWKVRRREL